ncbi:MAG TPA: hypothetical protein H9909_10480 [Candidatus Mediterraneibacter norfolkensis]|nr:hypothetical protein [Candidatus Mediterraneibacter norfolkensis]
MELTGKILRTAALCLSMWGYFFAVFRFGKVKIWFVPIVTMAGMGLVLFWGALAGVLKQTAGLLLLGGLAGAVSFLVLLCRKRIRLPGLSLFGVCFAAGIIVFVWLTLSLKLVHYDNFSHWALIVKYLLSADQLPGADTELIHFRDYPPGSSLFIYYICRYAVHSQGVMLLAQNSLIFACFFSVFGIVREKRRFLLYSFLGMGCAVLSYLNLTIRINSLLVDFLLPLLSMASFAVSYRCREEKGKLCILQILLLGYTGIVKSTGLFFAGIAGVYALWKIFRQEKASPETILQGKTAPGKRIRRFLYAVLLVIGMVLPFLAWRYHLETDLAGFTGKFEIGGGGSEGAPVGEALYDAVTRDFIRMALDPEERAVQVFLLCNVLSLAAVLFARLKMKRRWNLGKALVIADIVVLLYHVGMLYMYLYTMPAEEALRLAGFERYACSIMVLAAGMLIMVTVTDMERSFAVSIDERGPYRAYSSPAAKRRYQYGVLGTFLVAVNFLYSEVNGLRSIQQDYANTLPGRVERIVGDHWYEGTETDEKSYLVVASDREGQVSDGEVRYVCRYFLWAEDVDVTDGTDGELLEEADGKYDRVIILDSEAAEYPVYVQR